MKKRHLNKLMLLFSVIGGIIGYVVGEVLVNLFMFRLPNVLIVGIYFAVFSLCVAIMCLLAEMISPKITGPLWKSFSLKTSVLVFLPLLVVSMFAFGCFAQFIYGLDSDKKQPVKIDDYVFLMDNSGSMTSTDPDNLRISGLNDLVDSLDERCRISYYAFTNETKKCLPLKYANQSTKNALKNATSLTQSDGGTDINLALTTALNDVKNAAQPDRKMALVLVSDGYDNFETKPLVDACNSKNITIHCIGLGNSVFGSNDILYKLTDGTDGCFYDIQSANQLAGIYSNIENGVRNSRILLNARHGAERTSALLGTERVLFIAVFGLIMALGLGAIFDNRQLFKNFLIGGAVTGVLAGLVMEVGFYLYCNTRFCRMGMDVLLALVMCMFTAVVAYDINDNNMRSGRSNAAIGGITGTFGGSSQDYTPMQFTKK